MDLLSIDVTSIKEVSIGDRVTLWGKGLPIEHVAEQMNLTAYELLTGVGARVQREVVEKSDIKGQRVEPALI